jgi:hypothetical protein
MESINMTTGAGIAIAGVWIFAGLFGISKRVTSFGTVIAIICAFIVTYILS